MPGRNGIFVGGIATQGTAAVPQGGGTATLSTFGGGIVNSGTISAATAHGIFVGGNATRGGVVNFLTFSGGISNSSTGSIFGKLTAILVGGSASGAGSSVTLSTFTGGLTNAGTITSAIGNGIFIGGTGVAGGTVTVSNFLGGVTNSGTIGSSAIGIGLSHVVNFQGDITNTGTISGKTAISLVSSTINGSIVDSGVINGLTHGIVIDKASSIISGGTAILVSGAVFNGDILTSGIITGNGGTAINLSTATAPQIVVNITGGAINGNIQGNAANPTFSASRSAPAIHSPTIPTSPLLTRWTSIPAPSCSTASTKPTP